MLSCAHACVCVFVCVLAPVISFRLPQNSEFKVDTYVNCDTCMELN